MSDNRPMTYDDDGKVIYRASGFGHCINQLVYSRLGFDPVGYPQVILDAFAYGNEAEQTLIRHLRRKEVPGDPMSFWSLYDFQKEYDLELLPGKVLRCHVDAIGSHFSTTSNASAPFGTQVWNIEFKALGQDLCRLFLASGLDDLPTYKTQVSIQSLATGYPTLFVVLDKAETEKANKPVVHWEVYPTPPLSRAYLIKRLLEVERRVKLPIDQLPPCETEIWYCPFYKFHPDQAQIPSFTTVNFPRPADNQTLALVQRFSVLADDLRLLKKQQDEVKSLLLELIPADQPILLNDNSTFEFKTISRIKWEYSKLAKVCKEHGIDVADYQSKTYYTRATFGRR